MPGASHSSIVGWLGDSLKVRVSAPPERGKANESVLKLIAQQLDLPSNSICLVSGARSARKTIEITGMAEAEVRQRLAKT